MIMQIKKILKETIPKRNYKILYFVFSIQLRKKHKSFNIYEIK